MLTVGLTGGAASGKTAAASLFAELGAEVVDTDVLAREVVAPGEPGLDAVAAAFGKEILLDSGELDRGALRALVFRSPERRRRLEAILHPLIRERTTERLGRLVAPYVIVVVPLLFESGFDTLVDRTAVVDCPEEMQLRRLAQRDGLERADAQAMLDAQLPRQARLSQADDIIDNSGDIEHLRTQVAALHARYSRHTDD